MNSFSQFGVRTKYNVNNYSPGPEFFSFENGYEIGLDYWFRLKDRRIEFLPEVSFEISDGLVSAQPVDVSFSSFNFNLNINIYPLDFYNDCDCPTFSKEGGPLEKGFHFIISPGIRYYSWDNLNLSDDNQLAIMGGMGIGLDLGINDLLTITPSVIYRYSLSPELVFTNDIGAGNMIDGNMGQLLLGLRLGFRPDYQTPRFGR